MRLALTVLALMSVSLQACSTPSMPPAVHLNPPALPALSDQQRAPCPPLPPLSNTSIGELVTKDAAASLEYSRCSAKHDAVVDVYDQVKATIQSWIDSTNTPEGKPSK